MAFAQHASDSVLSEHSPLWASTGYSVEEPGQEKRSLASWQTAGHSSQSQDRTSTTEFVLPVIRREMFTRPDEF